MASVTQPPTTESPSTTHGKIFYIHVAKKFKTSYFLCFFTADGLGTVEGEKHGEYLESSVAQLRPPTSTPDKRQPPNCGMIKSHLPYTTF